MKLQKILRPEIEVEFIGVKGFFAALLAICKIGIKKANINFVIKTYLKGNAGTVKKHSFYVIPKYKLKSVEPYNSIYDNANKCVHCGAVIPEGRLSCPNCEKVSDTE